jgi:hypothetical protein
MSLESKGHKAPQPLQAPSFAGPCLERISKGLCRLNVIDSRYASAGFADLDLPITRAAPRLLKLQL